MQLIENSESISEHSQKEKMSALVIQKWSKNEIEKSQEKEILKNEEFEELLNLMMRLKTDDLVSFCILKAISLKKYNPLIEQLIQEKIENLNSIKDKSKIPFLEIISSIFTLENK